MKNFFYVAILVLVVSFQMAVLPQLRIDGATLNLILALALALSILKEGSGVKWFVAASAVLYDLAASFYFGFFSASILLSFFAVRWLCRFILKQSGLWAVSFLILIGTAAFEISIRVFRKIAWIFFPKYFFADWPGFFSALPAGLIANFAFGLAVFYFLKSFLPNLIRLASKRKKKPSFILPND